MEIRGVLQMSQVAIEMSPVGVVLVLLTPCFTSVTRFSRAKIPANQLIDSEGRGRLLPWIKTWRG
jgi:hypothetical protein